MGIKSYGLACRCIREISVALVETLVCERELKTKLTIAHRLFLRDKRPVILAG
jgi:hypothetical protein